VVARAADSDNDGVPDTADQCPGTPSGAAVDAVGCELDADRDGVVDRLDRCPGTAAGVPVDAAGCAQPVVLKGVNFENNSARLTPASFAVLDEAAATLIKRGDVKVEVAGHTDSRGAAKLNQSLSQRRAEAVRAYLVSKGVPEASLSARGYGAEKPIADNRTASGRAANRRVELRTQ
jgi:OOP family OmpA-OmpF porin